MAKSNRKTHALAPVAETPSPDETAAESVDSVVVTLTSRIDVYIDQKSEVDETFTLLLADIPPESVATIGDILALRGLKVILDTTNPATKDGKPSETRSAAVKRRLAAIQDGTYSPGAGGRRPVSDHDKHLHKMVAGWLYDAHVALDGKPATKAQIDDLIATAGAYGAWRQRVIEPDMLARGWDADRQAAQWEKMVAGAERKIAALIALERESSAPPSLDSMLESLPSPEAS